MRKFSYDFLKQMVPGTLVNISNIIYDLRAKERLRRKDNGVIFDHLRESAIIDSVRGSNAIEGIVTTEQRIRDIIQSGDPPRTHDEKEIAGYKQALDEVFSNYKSLDLNQKTVCHLHSLLLSDTSMDAGQYKSDDNFILEIRADGTRAVRFRPVSAADTPQAMEQMMLAYYDARQDSSVNSLLLIGCVILDFLCIHPFRDGNGRVSRLLTVLLLLKAGFDIGRYISIEGKINEYKDAYYEALRESSVDWQTGSNDYTPFMINFMQILYYCYKDLDECFLKDQSGKVPKNKRVENLLMNSIVPISKTEICEKLPDISAATVEKVLGEMTKSGRIRKIGSYRNARYIVR